MTDYYAQLVQMTKMLRALDGWLEKGRQHAEAAALDTNTLLQARLAPDMYTLSWQVQAACDGVKFLAARTSGRDAPVHPDGDEFTLEQLRTRIRAVLDYVAGFSAKDFEGADQRVVPLSFIPGKGIRAADFMRELNVPNTYFHFSLAYAILRHSGVNLGKVDFIGSLTLQDL